MKTTLKNKLFKIYNFNLSFLLPKIGFRVKYVSLTLQQISNSFVLFKHKCSPAQGCMLDEFTRYIILFFHLLQTPQIDGKLYLKIKMWVASLILVTNPYT